MNNISQTLLNITALQLPAHKIKFVSEEKKKNQTMNAEVQLFYYIHVFKLVIRSII